MEGDLQNARFAAAVRLFDEENAKDPNRVVLDGVEQGRELVYARRLTDWVTKLCPQASEALRLAARCQHLCRWLIPRESYPLNRMGYLRWRETLKRFHAEKAAELLRQADYPEDVIARVQALNLKRDFPADPESRILEDALCLVFLEHQLRELIPKTSAEKLAGVLRKTWSKMTPSGQALARGLPFSIEERKLLEQALARTGQGTGG